MLLPHSQLLLTLLKSHHKYAEWRRIRIGHNPKNPSFPNMFLLLFFLIFLGKDQQGKEKRGDELVPNSPII